MAHTEYLRRALAAQVLGVSPSWLAKAAMRGDGPPMVKVGQRLVLYRRADLDAWAAERVRRSTADPGPPA